MHQDCCTIAQRLYLQFSQSGSNAKMSLQLLHQFQQRMCHCPVAEVCSWEIFASRVI